MDCQEPRPLTLAEAKNRVRAAAQKASLTTWVKENPSEAVLTSFLLGFKTGTPPGSIERAQDFARTILTFMQRCSD